MAEYTCIICPMSCHLTVTKESDGTLTVSGNNCKRGETHGINEYTNPKRMLTTTVVVKNCQEKRLAVVSKEELPKELLSECLKELYKIEVTAPVHCGDVVIKDICHTGIDIVSTCTIE